MQIDIPLCPILKPTYSEFADFRGFVERVERQYRGEYGMVKIIPPAQWVSRSDNYHKILKKLKDIRPEYQTLCGNRINYFFTCQNQKCEPMTLSSYKAKAAKKEKQSKAARKIELVEKEFWSNISTVQRELYGANVEISLMDHKSQSWAFQNLNSFFSDIVTEKIHGLNTSFLFVGAWKTFFNWHIEDLDLSAINLLHEGAPKMWYAVHPQDRRKFESIMGTLFPEQAMKCSNFLRHKQVFTDPYRFKKHHPSIRISKMYQCQGEISLAFAEAYHSGFNMGFNIAEAVNYGTSEWLQRYTKFKGCRCPLKIGVQLDHTSMLKNILKSPKYKSLKKLDAFKKLQEKIQLQNLPQKQFEQADSAEVELEIEKAKKHPSNRDKKLIYVSKYNRYFPAEKTYLVECNECKKWRKITKTLHDQNKDTNISCDDIGYVCKEKANKKQQKPLAKHKKVHKISKSLKKKKVQASQPKSEVRITRSGYRSQKSAK